MLAAIVFGHLRSFKQPPLRPPPSEEGGVSWQAAMPLGLRSLCLR